MSKTKVVDKNKDFWEKEIEWLEEQLQFRREQVQRTFRYHTCDINALNEAIGDLNYRIGNARRMLAKIYSREEQHDQDR